ncbi:UDP-N-acetylmuramate dehydrogenase [Spirulina subsalsa FACHB-351]|uniref:UDP-N-acetylenolpyruvoylglucosamine reductase n=1 Tax=Spirulina subsalsa FACHB-351 TaxID=234711 RepID=A0ABT3L9Q7_9CYAN|nr:UDP-N-acetylmuramate dehydrogenase [Spirulina subsalsa]MCW6038233.1 UDP-N-acetylmuramate dehydrogenase [Spirulina subsalsa FACHB-351]
MTLSSDAPSTKKLYFYGGKSFHPSPVSLKGTDCIVRPDVPLAPLTSFRVGGPAEWYVAPRTLEDLQLSVAWADQQSLPATVLGAGSNLLVSDRGIPGLVISTRHLRHNNLHPDNGQIIAGAGEPIARLAWKAAKRGWQGLEWAVGIPGTIGGCVVMNAGAHQKAIADCLTDVLVLNPDGSLNLLTPEDLQFSYRTSILQGDRKLVLQATLQLTPGGDRAEIMAQTTHNLHQRKETQPYHLPSCGSVFRNPYPHSAGWLIEQLGLKGYQVGGAQVAHRHANFILNCGDATASDILNVIHHVQEKVEQHWSLLLHPEVKLMGDF